MNIEERLRTERIGKLLLTTWEMEQQMSFTL